MSDGRGVGLGSACLAVSGAQEKAALATPLRQHCHSGVFRSLMAVAGGVSGTAMQAFGGQLNDVELAAVLTYQRNAFENTGDVVQPGDVAGMEQLGEHEMADHHGQGISPGCLPLTTKTSGRCTCGFLCCFCLAGFFMVVRAKLFQPGMQLVGPGFQPDDDPAWAGMVLGNHAVLYWAGKLAAFLMIGALNRALYE